MADKSHHDHGHGTATRDKAAHITAKNLTKDERAFLEEHAADLSGSTLRARWIHTPDEHEDHQGETLATQSHEVIKAWASERGGIPATVEGTEHGDRPGVLRIDFQAKGNGRIQDIDWDKWFASFDTRNLVFIYQEHKRNGDQSTFFRLDNPEREDA